MLAYPASEGIIESMHPFSDRKSVWKTLVSSLICATAIAACTPPVTPPEVPSATQKGQLTPYRTATPSATLTTHPFDQATATPTATPIPPPTPTPVTYQIVEGDTLLGIALRYGTTLDELLTVNPGIDPNFLTIGLTITLPIGENGSNILPTATPISIQIDPPHCFPITDLGQWCLITVDNDQDEALDNISVRITYPGEDQTITQIAYTPLNRLAVGQSIPILVSLQSSPGVIPSVELLTALPVTDGDQRYLENEFQIAHQHISASGQEAKIGGEVLNSTEEQIAKAITLIAIAYDRQGFPIGLRKLEIEKELHPGDGVEFEITVYSLGPTIDQVVVIAEMRP
jgi:LysM repeat protein